MGKRSSLSYVLVFGSLTAAAQEFANEYLRMTVVRLRDGNSDTATPAIIVDIKDGEIFKNTLQ